MCRVPRCAQLEQERAMLQEDAQDKLGGEMRKEEVFRRAEEEKTFLKQLERRSQRIDVY